MRFAQAVLVACALHFATTLAAAEDAPAPAAPVPVPATGSATQPPAPSAEAGQTSSKLPKPTEQLAFVPSGEKRLVWFMSSVNPDCTSLGTTAYRILSKPQHGDITFENGTGFVTFPSGNREHCNSEKVAGLVVSYQSNPDYVGEDRFSVLFLIPPTLAKIIDFDMIIR